MDQTIVQLINQMGFPIVAALLMWHLITTTLKENTSAIEGVKTVLADLTAAIKGAK